MCGIAAASLFFVKEYPRIIPVLFVMVGFGVVGFLDDYIKIVMKRSEGLNPKQKLLCQILITGVFCYYLCLLYTSNRTVCTISVIHNQITDPDRVVEVLSKELGMDEDKVRTSVEKYTSREVIKSNVDKSVGDSIRQYALNGVKVDEDYKRYYPFDTLASKVLGFTGSDNQGIIGLEVKYEDVLKGIDGQILTPVSYTHLEVCLSA